MSTLEVNTDATGMVIRGYDPVAYFTEGRPGYFVVCLDPAA